jgi:uncharacterized integral membrane protein
MSESDSLQEESNPVVSANPEEKQGSRKKLWLVILIGGVIIALLVAGIVLLSTSGTEVTSQVRDIFVILMALESIVIGAALVILVVQIASLINLLQNEIKPILKSTSDTVNTLKGTTTFLSDNLASPVIKLNSSVAGLRKIFELIGLFRK